MDFTRTQLLTVTPLVLTAMTTGVVAQESTSAASLLSLSSQSVSAAALKSSASISLRVNIPTAGTYVFSAPAGSNVKLRLNGEPVLDAASAQGSVKVFTTLTAGTHLLEASGENVTLEKVAAISANLLGMPISSLANFVEAVSAEEAATIASRLVALPSTGSKSTTDQSIATRLTSGQFVSGGGSLLTGSGTSNVSTTTGNSTNGNGRPSTGTGFGTMPEFGASDQSSVRNLVRNAVRNSVTAAITSGSTPRGPVAPPIGDGEAQSSALSPPSGVALTEAVEIIGGATEQRVVASTGQTLFGGVMDPMTYDTVSVTVEPSNRTTVVDVGATTGQFAMRLFPADLATGTATVTVIGMSSVDDTVVTAPISYTYESGAVADGVSQALTRITYGPTAELYSRVKALGFENYVNEQLNPGRIRDSAFEGQNFDRYINNLTDNFGRVATGDMSHRMAYAAFSDKQLQEVMGDFWSNHFFASTKDTRVYEQNIIDREFYRQNAFGNFEDLLSYSARSPLMSQFLDNDQSRVGRLNENYGREILELHTVGVDGGYGDDDVIAVSRVFTGWNFRRTNPDSADGVLHNYVFDFLADRHDSEDKAIPFLGTTIAGQSGANGVREAEQLIAILADDTRTHNYVCGKIVQRFVADVPPANFVQLCVDAWVASDGNTTDILRAILLAPEFTSNTALQGNKAKTPYEYSISAIRALGAEPDAGEEDPNRFFQTFRQGSEDAGYDPLRFGLPTGLAETGASWISSASMIGSYRRVTSAVDNPGRYNIDLQAKIEAAGLETAEEVAAFMLTIATADRYTLEEYEALVGVLKGTDGIFEPLGRNEARALESASGLLIVLPSFLLQ